MGKARMVCMLLGACVADAMAAEDWQNLHAIQINAVAPHSTMPVHADQADALAMKRNASELMQLLNGDWKFNWVSEPSLRPMDFDKTDFDDGAIDASVRQAGQ